MQAVAPRGTRGQIKEAVYVGWQRFQTISGHAKEHAILEGTSPGNEYYVLPFLFFFRCTSAPALCIAVQESFGITFLVTFAFAFALSFGKTTVAILRNTVAETFLKHCLSSVFQYRIRVTEATPLPLPNTFATQDSQPFAAPLPKPLFKHCLSNFFKYLQHFPEQCLPMSHQECKKPWGKTGAMQINSTCCTKTRMCICLHPKSLNLMISHQPCLFTRLANAQQLRHGHTHTHATRKREQCCTKIRMCIYLHFK